MTSAPAFARTSEQDALAASVRGFLTKHADLSSTRRLFESGERMDTAHWKALSSDLGLTALAIPEAHGGLGGNYVDLAIVCEEMGRVLHGGPFFSSAVLSTAILVAADNAVINADVLPALASGEITAAAVLGRFEDREGPGKTPVQARQLADGNWALDGHSRGVLDGADADLLVIRAGNAHDAAFYLVDSAEGVERRRTHTLDRTRSMADIEFTSAPCTRIGTRHSAAAVLKSALAVSRTMLAAESAGAMSTCVALSAEYSRTRIQFGVPIGTFQAVKHRVADMAVRLEGSVSSAFWAASQLDAGDASSRWSLIAGVYASESFLQTALDTIQIHGGTGYTWEHDAHLFLRRARANHSVLGEPSHLRKHLSELALEPDSTISENEEAPVYV
nr:acyl-CoA dehydrogenase family protein [Rhodococcus sp. 15-1154-1]